MGVVPNEDLNDVTPKKIVHITADNLINSVEQVII